METSDIGGVADVGTAAGKWLFKQGDLLLGPVPFMQLVSMLNQGDVDGETLVSEHGGEPSFRRLQDLEPFRVYLAKAQAKLRVERLTEEQSRSAKRGRLLKIAGVGGAGLLAVFGGAQLAGWLAVNRPWETRIEIPEPVITEEMPELKLASARAEDDELTYPDRPSRGRGARPAPRPAPAAAAGAPGGSAPPAPMVDNDVNSLQTFDQKAINEVVRASKKTLHACLAAEAQRQQPGWRTRIPLEFTIGNDGQVTKLWLDNPDYRSEDGDLHRCMLGALQRWRFPRYEGEQANVALAFSIEAPR